MSGMSDGSLVVPPIRADMHFMANKYSGTGVVRRKWGNWGRVPVVVP